MKIRTFSIIAGSEACNARCPFCVSKMTPPLGMELKEPEVNWRNFEVACRFAKQNGVTTAMFTGKGEPTLFPRQITKFLYAMAKHEFPLIELQTNGIMVAQRWEEYVSHLSDWYKRWMTTIAISIVHYDPEKNRQIYLPYKKEYIDLPLLINKLHVLGFSVRLTCIGAKGFINSPRELQELIIFAKKNHVEQLTFTPVNKPDDTDIINREAWEWAKEHHLTDELPEIIKYLERDGHHLLTLSHGARVYEMHGQNICLNYCLTVQPEAEEMRNLIFYPDGHLRSYWQYPGSIII